MSIYFEPNSLFFIVYSPEEWIFSPSLAALGVTWVYTSERGQPSVIIQYNDVSPDVGFGSALSSWHSGLDLQRAEVLPTASGLFKVPTHFSQSRKPMSLLPLHPAYLISYAFFFPGRLPSACQTCTAAWNSTIGSALILPPWSCWCSFYFLTLWFWLSWCMDNSSSFLLVLDFSARV